jgi:hypothetical protein
VNDCEISQKISYQCKIKSKIKSGYELGEYPNNLTSFKN